MQSLCATIVSSLYVDALHSVALLTVVILAVSDLPPAIAKGAKAWIFCLAAQPKSPAAHAEDVFIDLRLRQGTWPVQGSSSSQRRHTQALQPQGRAGNLAGPAQPGQQGI